MCSDDTTLDPTAVAAQPRAGALEIRGVAIGLLDEPIDLRVRGAGPDARLVWRARYRDDDGRIWRSAGLRCEDLATGWSPLKDGTGDMAALRSLRAVRIDVRVEGADGRGVARALTRRIAGEGVRTRRWRDGLAATLHVPAGATAGATVVIDAAGTPAQAAVAALAAPLLASRGVLVLVVGAAAGRATGDPIARACERLAAVPAAGDPIVVLSTADPFAKGAGDPEAVVLPPGVGVREPHAAAAAERAGAWDRLLERLGALPRLRPGPR
ncbi:MAG TPA: hypothetical protein VGF63_02030 [Solirubrobacteraceae bacterium]|jgi:hypothetical protein